MRNGLIIIVIFFFITNSSYAQVDTVKSNTALKILKFESKSETKMTFDEFKKIAEDNLKYSKELSTDTSDIYFYKQGKGVKPLKIYIPKEKESIK